MASEDIREPEGDLMVSGDFGQLWKENHFYVSVWVLRVFGDTEAERFEDRILVERSH